MVDAPPLHRSAEIEDLTHITREDEKRIEQEAVKGVNPAPLHRSAEVEDLAHLSPQEINKPLVSNQDQARHRQSKRALIVVDIQKDYFPGGQFTLSGMDAAANNAARLIAAARASGDLVVHIRHEFPTDDAPFFKPGSVGAQIHPKVQQHDDEYVVLKHNINSYRGTNLKDILDRNGIREVVICGAMSHMCVDAATRASNDFGYDCTVIHDACASRDLEFNGIQVPAAHAHAAFMAALQFGYAKTVSTDEFLLGKTTQA